MTARIDRQGAIARALGAARGWLIEPPEQAEPWSGVHPVVAVFGLGRGCGATTIARALALELAARAEGAATVSGGLRGGALVASPGSLRLARVLAEVPAARTRAVGRLCLVAGPGDLALADTARHHAPLVIDGGSAELGGTAASVADRVVLVAGPRIQPALSELAAGCLARIGGKPLVALNRAGAGERWEGAVDVSVPMAAFGARLARAGYRARGGLGAAACRLAQLVGG